LGTNKACRVMLGAVGYALNEAISFHCSWDVTVLSLRVVPLLGNYGASLMDHNCLQVQACRIVRVYRVPLLPNQCSCHTVYVPAELSVPVSVVRVV
jgi:hypothetical protein